MKVAVIDAEKISKPKIAEHVASFLDGAPEMMAKLTREFVEATDLNSRAKIRARMKAILDFVSVDTSYPAMDATGRGVDLAGYEYAVGGGRTGVGGVHLIPGADNTL